MAGPPLPQRCASLRLIANRARMRRFRRVGLRAWSFRSPPEQSGACPRAQDSPTMPYSGELRCVLCRWTDLQLHSRPSATDIFTGTESRSAHAPHNTLSRVTAVAILVFDSF
uniref:Uncharacterized protein n=1 Tax=Knipowitschia caucasica TaxID=637954 RepID=A0AAV2MHW8_KNICA